MITQALSHCRGIGPARLSKLHALGIRSWQDVLGHRDLIPAGWQHELITECERCLSALKDDDIAYFVQRFAPRDRWRILSQFLEQASFFDIETAGLQYDAPITVIVCRHQGQLRTFVEHENLDDFLSLLDEVKLLISFNGGSFDVPRVLTTFHIPQLPCAHLDLRWLCYHRGFRGGLKEIAARQGIVRPIDLQNADGELAIRLWSRWEQLNDSAARDELIRYCSSDVLLLVMLAWNVAGRMTSSQDQLWAQLPVASANDHDQRQFPETTTTTSGAFDAASPDRLRARRPQLVG